MGAVGACVHIAVVDAVAAGTDVSKVQNSKILHQEPLNL